MNKDLGPVLGMEMENIMKDADNPSSIMKSLNSYAENMDPRAIPQFLALLSGTMELGSSLGKCTIFLCEVLVRVHGPNIAPYVDDIMDAIVQMLVSSAGSFDLNQDCVRIIPMIARYGCDPSGPENEKARIILCLSEPLYYLLMGPNETVACAAALCLKSLVESCNWQFASDHVVNEVWLKVTGALDGKLSQPYCHMDLVMALVKHNALVAEPYARSLVRSGLRILTTCLKESEAQKRLPTIRMINFLMQGVDSIIISSETFRVVDAMENYTNDNSVLVRAAAFEALQTAKMVAGQKVSQQEICSSHILDLYFDRKIDIKEAAGLGSLVKHPPPMSQVSDEDILVYPLLSVGEHYYESPKRNNSDDGSDTRTEDGFCNISGPSGDDSNDRVSQTELSGAHKKTVGTMAEFCQPSTMNVVSRSTSPSSQRSEPHMSLDESFRPSGVNVEEMPLTPQNPIQSLQCDTISECFDREPPGMTSISTLSEMEVNEAMTFDEDDHSQNVNSELIAKRTITNMEELTKQNDTDGAQLAFAPNGTASSNSDVPLYGSKNVCSGYSEGKSEVIMCKTKKKIRGWGRVALGTMCCISTIIYAMIVSTRLSKNEHDLLHTVPT